MLLIEDKIDLTSDQKKFINFVDSSHFPLYSSIATTESKYPLFGHTLRNRDNYDRNSDFCNIAESICINFCSKNDIQINKIYRSSINVITYNPYEYGDIHKDYLFDHKIFIYYINEFDKGSTYLFDDNKNITHIIEGKKGNGCIFENVFHAAGNPSINNVRKTLVVAFN